MLLFIRRSLRFLVKCVGHGVFPGLDGGKGDSLGCSAFFGEWLVLGVDVTMRGCAVRGSSPSDKLGTIAR